MPGGHDRTFPGPRRSGISAGMAPQPLTIWCNAKLPEAARAELLAGTSDHRLVFSTQVAGNLDAGGPDPSLAQADVAFGQPDPRQVIELDRLRWVHLTSAGYTRYDRRDVREMLRGRGAVLTNSSGVFDEACAQHVLAMMMAEARQLPAGWRNQAGDKGWPAAQIRRRSHLLNGQAVLILGFGAIARRLVELLAPFGMNITGVRRSPRGDEPVPCRPVSELAALLPHADHVVNILPSSPETEQLMNADMLGAMKPHAVFYNIGRGDTVDQYALRTALDTDLLAAAYLDVMTPEPLPPDESLWTTKNCHITPHTAGGSADEFERLIRHFMSNLRQFEVGKPLADRVM